MDESTQRTPPESRAERFPLLPRVHSGLCADGCGQQALPGSIYASIDCRTAVHARIDARIWNEARA